MNEFTVLAAIAALVMLFVLAEIAAAVLPIVIVVALVPPGDREALARVIAACDSSRKLRLWPALRAAVGARRCECAKPAPMNNRWDLDRAVDESGKWDLPLNLSRTPLHVDQPQDAAGSQR